MFTADPVTGEDRVIIEASWGLGESIVSGLVTPDSYVLAKDTLEVKDFTVNTKEQGYYLADGKNQLMDIPKDKAEARCADDAILKLIAEQGLALEKHFGHPQDIEWGVEDGKVYILPPELALVERIIFAESSAGCLPSARQMMAAALKDAAFDWTEARRLADLPDFKVLPQLERMRSELSDDR